MALANIERHARADRISIELSEDADGVIFMIADNGVGFDPPESRLSLARNRQFGLLGMREWADAIQATLDVDSAPGRGTRIRVSVPIDDNNRSSRDVGPAIPSLFLRFRRFIHG